MTVLSIQDAWAQLYGEAAPAPSSVRRAVAEGLAMVEVRGGLSISTRARAQAIADGRPAPRSFVRQVAEYHAGLEKGGDRDEALWLLHGGAAGRAWAGELEKGDAPERDDEDEGPVDHKTLRRRMSLHLHAHGPDGAPVESFRHHVEKHGHKAVARALRDLGVEHVGGKVRAPRAVVAPGKNATPDKRAKPKKARPAKKAKPSTEQRSDAPAPFRPQDPTAPEWRPFRFRGA